MIALLRACLLGLVLAASPALAQNAKTYIPKNAYALLPTVKSETLRIMPTIPEPAYIPSLIEQESCIRLTHPKCFSSTSELRTARERGLGLGQVTVAYRADGSVRFDTLSDLRHRYSSELKDMSWLTLKQRPDLQIRAIVLMIKESYNRFFMVKDSMERIRFADGSYNAGAGAINKERMACGLAKGCDPQYWTGNVERYCLRSKKAIYGNRSPCDITKEHVYNATYLRLPKYQRYYRDRLSALSQEDPDDDQYRSSPAS